MDWTDENVVVTGGAGFLGSYLVEALVSAKAKVTIVDDYSKPSHFKKFGKQVSIVKADLTRKDSVAKVAKIFKSKDVGVCFHLAAKIGGIGYFHKIPASLLRDNFIMTANMWDAARGTDTKMLYFSSSMVFESTNTFPSTEDSLKKCPPPITAYGFSKLCGEYICKSYNDEFGVKYVIVRPFNAYGPGENYGDYVGYAHVIPDFVKKMTGGQYPLEILGSGEQKRCFTYASDIAAGTMLVAKDKRAENEDFNIGSDREVRMKDLAAKMWKLCGRKEPLKFKHLPTFKDDVQRRVPNVSKVKALGWREQVSFDEGLTRTINWLREHGSVR
jgi:UDP-glucose 4-epimerase